MEDNEILETYMKNMKNSIHTREEFRLSLRTIANEDFSNVTHPSHKPHTIGSKVTATEYQYDEAINDLIDNKKPIRLRKLLREKNNQHKSSLTLNPITSDSSIIDLDQPNNSLTIAEASLADYHSIYSLDTHGNKNEADRSIKRPSTQGHFHLHDVAKGIISLRGFGTQHSLIEPNRKGSTMRSDQDSHHFKSRSKRADSQIIPIQSTDTFFSRPYTPDLFSTRGRKQEGYSAGIVYMSRMLPPGGSKDVLCGTLRCKTAPARIGVGPAGRLTSTGTPGKRGTVKR